MLASAFSAVLHAALAHGSAGSTALRMGRPAVANVLHERLMSSGSQAASEASSTSGSEAVPKLVVLGGRGFVGSAVCREALSTGLHVVGLSRAGTPPLGREPWAEQVQWARGNALEPQTYEQHLQGATAVISCVGAFGSQEEMLKLNGTANVMAVEAAKAAGVPRFVFISANIPPIPGIEYVLGGYVRGKRMAEEAMAKHYPQAGVYLRPGAIYGPRVLSHSLTLPLQYVLGPLESLLSSVPLLGAVIAPPISVQAVARAAVRSATDPSVPAGPMEVGELQKYR